MFNLNFSDLWLDSTEYLQGNLTSMVSSILALLVVVTIRRRCQGLRTPRLQGPRSESFIFGRSRKIFPSAKLSLVYRDWERTYGSVYEIPTGFGSKQVVLGDLKALTHLFSKDTTTYYQPARTKAVTRRTLGDILVITEGEAHKRMRRILSLALSASAIRNLTRTCLDSAYQLKAAWDSRFQPSNDAVVIHVEKSMSHVTLDSAGKVIMSHDFGALRGQKSPVLAEIDAYHAIKPSPFIRLMFFIVDKLNSLFNVSLPNAKEQQYKDLATHFKALTTDFLAKAREGPEDSDVHQSILGVMLRSESAESKIRLSLPEIMAQASGLVLAGFDTTTIVLTCSLIELARRPEIQETVRTELGKCLTEGECPTYDQLTKDLKYLDAFICETLRLHTPQPEIVRVAMDDDVIPLMDPVRTASGATIDSLFVRKGTVIRIPTAGLNISEELWGPDAGTFDPDRWLDVDDNRNEKKDKIPGYRNLLTFGGGPRLCPGRDFAILEVKAVLSVLVQHFTFEFPNGPSTELVWEFGRPKVASEDDITVPILVRRLTGI